MSDTVKAFIERVDRLEARYAKDKYATTFQMPRDLMIALRDELRKQYVPTIDEIVGLVPDITEGLSMKEYLDRISEDF